MSLPETPRGAAAANSAPLAYPAPATAVDPWEASPPRRIAILGVGLLGGSFGLAARKRFPEALVVGMSRNDSSRQVALDRGTIDEATADPQEACRDADLVVIATPVDHIAPLAIRAAATCRPEALVTDLGSTKQALVAAIESDPQARRAFVGAHPVAGGEKTGAEHARVDLFQDRPVILTPTPDTDPRQLAKSIRLWEAFGARVFQMSPAEHDQWLARISHVPHLVASMLANLPPEAARPLVGGGWLDTTRVASGSPEMWLAICQANREAIVAGLDEAILALSQFRRAVADGDRDELLERLGSAKLRRDTWLRPVGDH